jgi:hypothetical protein
MTTDEHLQEDDFRRGTRGRITFAQARHLESCAECKAVVREKYFDEAYRNLKRALLYDPPDDEPEPRRWGLWLAFAASVIVCIAGLVIVIALLRVTGTPADVPNSEAFLHGSPSWDDTVSEALRRGRIDPASPFPEATGAFQHAANDNGRPKIQRTPRDAAIRNAEAARRLRPADHLLLGVLYARAGMPADAERELTDYLRLHPDDRDARTLLGSTRPVTAK